MRTLIQFGRNSIIHCLFNASMRHIYSINDFQFHTKMILKIIILRLEDVMLLYILEIPNTMKIIF